MQPFPQHEPEVTAAVSPEALINPLVRNRELLSHLQTALPSPLDLVLRREPLSLLSQPVLQPALPEPERIEKPQKVVLGKEARLSECALWEIQENYWISQGANAWQNNVPTFITSSAYIAEAYAEMVLAFIEDYFDKLDLSEPLYILEMATGTGRFSHLMLKELESKLSSFSKYRNLRIRYIMTDFTETTPLFWESHEKLKPFVEKGMLEFATFNPMTDSSLTLRGSGEVIAPGRIKNPLIAIANYFFDSIKLDMFRVESKVLKEGLVTVTRNLEEADESAPPHIRELKTSFRYRDLTHDHYFSDARLNAVLKHYRHNVKNGTILFPTGAFDVLRNLETLSENRLVLISSDKAYTEVEEMTRFYHHDYAQHDGAFSYMVNYHAIGQYFKNAGGQFFYTNGRSLSVQTVCCVRLDEPEWPFEHLAYHYNHKMNRANTINSVCSAMPGKEGISQAVALTQMLSHVRLNLCDSQIFFMLGNKLVDILPHGQQSHFDDLLEMMEAAWENYYYFPGEANIPYWFAQIYHSLSLYEKSLEALDWAILYFGEHEVLHYLKGQNYEKLNRWHKAEECYQIALAMRPDFIEASDGLAFAQSRLKG